VDEARRIVDRVAELLADVGCVKFHDDVSTTQSANLDRIISWHNAQDRTLDVSVHLNCYDHSAHGTEVLYVTQNELAREVSEAIALAGDFTNRGAKHRSDLAFLNGTEEPAILIETYFCDHTGDCNNARAHFEEICHAIAETISGTDIDWRPPVEPEEPIKPPELEGVLFHTTGTCSWFGGPDDTGVSAEEGLAFIYDVNEARHLFLSEQPDGTTGLARRLNPQLFYVACRWDYHETPKSLLADPMYRALVRNPKTGAEFLSWPADWGPHEDTGRVADLSPGLMEALDLSTDDEVEVIYPAPEPT
jgi:hypothetical protein